MSDAIQLGAQALLLSEEGYQVPRVEVYYAESKKLVTTPWSESLAKEVRLALVMARETASAGKAPPPLEDSPKCHRCSLNEVCLPEESALLATGEATYLDDPDAVEPPVKRVIPARIDETILVVDTVAATVRKKGDGLSVEVPEAIAEKEGVPRKTVVSFDALHEVVLVGSIQVTAQTMFELLARGIPVTYLTRSGRLLGTVGGVLGNNVRLRIEQHRLCREELGRLPAARWIVAGKIRNQRTFLRRNDHDLPEAVLTEMASLASDAAGAGAIDTLMGYEGRAARLYFERFAVMVSDRTGGTLTMDGRNRRPPKDPVNAMLSFGYAVLTKDLVAVVHRAGFDPLVGFLHSPGYGRPSLALDLIEEFRSLIVDSTVLRMLAQSQAGPEDFLRRPGSVVMSTPVRKRLIRALEQRKKEMVTHPVFGYRISYARTFDVQARFLARWVMGEAPEYLPFTTR
jgi:CRISPR-associated protein Cas1